MLASRIRLLTTQHIRTKQLVLRTIKRVEPIQLFNHQNHFHTHTIMSAPPPTKPTKNDKIKSPPAAAVNETGEVDGKGKKEKKKVR